MQQSHFDTVIIGAGLSGLAAGIRLAHYNKNVLILERHNAIGGLNSFYSIAGRKFDVGLHAVTNFAKEGTKGSPLTKLFRQLRIPREAFDLSPQTSSRTTFPGLGLRFSNDIELLKSEVATNFPKDADAFNNLCQRVQDDFNQPLDSHHQLSSREVLAHSLTDPALQELILMPILFYGSSQPDDIVWSQFCVLFKSLYLEGFARPYEGVRLMLRVLKNKFKELGGIRKMKCGVKKIITEGTKAKEMLLDNGEIITADTILSSAGLPETLRMCSDSPADVEEQNIGQFSFAETTTVFPQQPKDLGWEETIIFFSKHPTLRFRAPENLVDTSSGVICFPNNYEYSDNKLLPEGLLRVTTLANYENWADLSKEDYNAKKAELFPQIQSAALDFLPKIDREAFERSIITTDMFTPTTVKKYTGHIKGTIYGATNKKPDASTHLDNLFIIGTDQGFLGIIGAMLSGVVVANQHALNS